MTHLEESAILTSRIYQEAVHIQFDITKTLLQAMNKGTLVVLAKRLDIDLTVEDPDVYEENLDELVRFYFMSPEFPAFPQFKDTAELLRRVHQGESK